MKTMYNSLDDLVKASEEIGLPLHEVIILDEIDFTGKTREQIINKATKHLTIMVDSIEKGKADHILLPIEELTEQSEKMNSPPFFLSADLKEAVYWAMSVAEYNSNMGLVCAAPTAGSVGVFPATLLKAQQMLQKSDDALLSSFLVGGAIGGIIGNNASLSGSEGGCQAEVGTAAAMAAAAITYLSDGTNEQVIQSVGLVLINMLGLICDPVAGLVITPCIKRNAIGVINAFLGAEMACSGVVSVIPPDEIIQAMGEVGKKLPVELRETGKGGIAGTKTAKDIHEKLVKESNDSIV